VHKSLPAYFPDKGEFTGNSADFGGERLSLVLRQPWISAVFRATSLKERTGNLPSTNRENETEKQDRMAVGS
jgi:hypothetical protein